jgi:hypothetical protein
MHVAKSAPGFGTTTCTKGMPVKAWRHAARVHKGTSGTIIAWHYSFQGKITTPAWSKPKLHD